MADPSMPNTVSDSARPASWATHAAFLVASSVACLVWSWYAGRDLNWDQLNYHFYAAYHFLDGRLERDFMGASIQGYLNPLGYVPFYLMVRANWPSLLIGSVLALTHSTCLWLIYGISRELIPAEAPGRIAIIAASVALAFLAPIYHVELGSSFIDVTTTIPILAGVLLLLICNRSTHVSWLVLVAGLLMGAATGLKLTNAIFAVAASVFIVLATRPVMARIRDMGIYVAGGFAGFLIVEGAWAYQLFRTFGNPFFPWFNAWFPSPDFPRFNIEQYRFLTETLADYVLFPVRLLDLTDHVYTESTSPDIRILAFFALMAAMGLAFVIRRRQPSDVVHSGRLEVTGSRPYIAALAFTLVSYALWLGLSANGRYALALQLFIGPMIAASAVALFRSTRILISVIASILLVQAAVVWVSADRRWQSANWKATWYDLTVPAALQQRAFLYLSMDPQSAAFLAPFLNPGSSFVNLVGQTSLAPDRPGGKRLSTLLDRNRPNIRALILIRAQTETGEPHPVIFQVQDSILERVGLRNDPNDCLTIVLGDVVAHRVLVPIASTHPSVYRPNDTQFLTCATIPVEAAGNSAQSAERLARVDRAFDMLEAHCPRLFSPARPYTDHMNTSLSRNYVNSDSLLRETGGLIHYSGWRPGPPLVLGNVDSVLDGSLAVDCRAIRKQASATRK